MIDVAQGIEGLEGVLEDRLHEAQQAPAAGTAAQLGDVLALKTQAPRRWRLEAEDHAGECRLTAARLPKQRKHLGAASGKRKAHIAHGGNATAAQQAAEGLGYALKFEQRRHHTDPPTAKQATRCSGATVVMAGVSRRQRSIARGQRG